MSDTMRSEDWSMISAIRLPRQLYVGFTFDGEIRTVELSYEFDYLNAFDEIRLRCDHSTWPGGPVSNNWSMHFSTTDMQRYLEDSIDTHTPLQDQPEFSECVRQLSYDVLTRIFDYRLPIYRYDDEQIFIGGEGMITLLKDSRTCIPFQDMTFEVTRTSTNLRDYRERHWLVRGSTRRCKFASGQRVPQTQEEISVRFLHHNKQQKISIGSAVITAIRPSEASSDAQELWDIFYEMIELPVVEELSTLDLRQLEIDKMRLAASNGTSTAKRILSIRINETINEKYGPCESANAADTKAASNIQNRFARILSQ